MCFRFAWCERLRCARVITSVNLSCWQINHIYRSEKGAKARHCWRKKFKWPDSQLLLCLEKIKCLGYRAAGILTSCREKVQQKQVLKWLYYSKLTRGNYAKLPKLKWLSRQQRCHGGYYCKCGMRASKAEWRLFSKRISSSVTIKSKYFPNPLLSNGCCEVRGLRITTIHRDVDAYHTNRNNNKPELRWARINLPWESNLHLEELFISHRFIW